MGAVPNLYGSGLGFRCLAGLGGLGGLGVEGLGFIPKLKTLRRRTQNIRNPEPQKTGALKQLNLV